MQAAFKTARRCSLAETRRLKHCICKQYGKALPVDPYEIEDTSDWLGCPTELETCRHFLRMYENEVQELTLQLRKSRRDIFNLVQMHAEVSKERDRLRAQLNRALASASDANRRVTDIETKTNWELMANAKVISELHAKLRELTGVDPFTQIAKS